MATLMGLHSPLGESKSNLRSSETDPFVSPNTNLSHYRFSHFDHHLFASSPSKSPDQTKRVLEAHLAETERRIQDASILGKKLVQQRKDLEGWLAETEKQQAEDNISPELRLKLVEIEKEYNEVGRESARALLSKSRVPNNEFIGSILDSNFHDKQSSSPSKEKFESQGLSSPSKATVVNRRQMNQPSKRIHDIEFATEISTSLLSQVRHLQALLVQKEEQLKAITTEKSSLELEIENYSERLRSLNENNERYKDENWSLETQVQEYISKDKTATDRERRLIQNFNVIEAEKNAAQKDLDEIKSIQSKLIEDHTAAIKHCDIELANVNRNLSMAESERNLLQHKVGELENQNKELVKVIAHLRKRLENTDYNQRLVVEELERTHDETTPEHSPPQSPVKNTPRHGMLESETLKSSLQHAHRMIQNLKSNIHREKSEKLELKRMLQDARDELDLRRGEMGTTGGRKSRKNEKKEHRKHLKLDQLGALRNSTCEAHIDESNWEDDDSHQVRLSVSGDDHVSNFMRNNNLRTIDNFVETSTFTPAGASEFSEFENALKDGSAFETTSKPSILRKNLQFDCDGISENPIETEGKLGGTNLSKSNMSASLQENPQSFTNSTYTSDDELDDSFEDHKVPSFTQPTRLRLRVSRGGYRRSRVPSEEPICGSSPASQPNTSRDGTPQGVSQSLFVELGEISASDEEESISETPTPSKISRGYTPSTSGLNVAKAVSSPLLMPRLQMIDSTMMTEPLEIHLPENQISKTQTIISEPSMDPTETNINLNVIDKISVATQIDFPSQMIHNSSQWSDKDAFGLEDTEYHSTPLETNTSKGSQYDSHEIFLDKKLAKSQSLPTSCVASPPVESDALQISLSTIISEELEPFKGLNSITRSHVEPGQGSLLVVPQRFVLSEIQHLEIEPIESSYYQVDDTIWTQDKLYVEKRIHMSELHSLEEPRSKVFDLNRADPDLRIRDNLCLTTDSNTVKPVNSLEPLQELSKYSLSQPTEQLQTTV